MVCEGSEGTQAKGVSSVEEGTGNGWAGTAIFRMQWAGDGREKVPKTGARIGGQSTVEVTLGRISSGYRWEGS